MHREHESTTGNRQWIALDELTLVPVRINRPCVTSCVELRDLFRSQPPSGGGKILSELQLVAGADDHAGHSGPLQQPV